VANQISRPQREPGKGGVDLEEVRVSGDQISFVEPLRFDDQEIRITYTGRISGDEMKLTRQVGDFATEELVARRVKEPAPPPAAANRGTLPPKHRLPPPAPSRHSPGPPAQARAYSNWPGWYSAAPLTRFASGCTSATKASTWCGAAPT